jgi:hypothetical protein
MTWDKGSERKIHIFIIYRLRPAVANRRIAIQAESHPESTPPLLLLSPVFGFWQPVRPRFVIIPVYTMQTHHLDQAHSSSRTHPGPMKMHSSELIGRYQDPGLSLLDGDHVKMMIVHFDKFQSLS